MGYWGWRPLVCSLFISVLIISCTSTPNTAPSPEPTQFPPITLTLRTAMTLTPSLTPGISLATTTTQSAPQITVSEGFQRVPTPLPIISSPPDCFFTVEAQWLCFGIVENSQPVSITRVIVEIVFTNQFGFPLHVEQISLPQRVIPPQTNAPYHVLIAPNTTLDAISRVDSTIIRAEPLSPQSPTLIPLTSSMITTEWQDDRFMMQGQISNPTARDAENIQVIVTLYDAIDRVVGYRVMTIENLNADATVPFELILRPQIISDDVTYVINVIGYAVLEE